MSWFYFFPSAFAGNDSGGLKNDITSKKIIQILTEFVDSSEIKFFTACKNTRTRQKIICVVFSCLFPQTVGSFPFSTENFNEDDKRPDGPSGSKGSDGAFHSFRATKLWHSETEGFFYYFFLHFFFSWQHDKNNSGCSRIYLTMSVN